MSGPSNNDWENDPVWNLIDDAKPPKAGPVFAQNVMREVRLSEDEKPAPWWQRLLAPKPLVAGALAATAAIAIIASLDFGSGDTPGLARTDDPATTPVELQQVDELVNEELVLEASIDPEAFPDEVLVALLY